MQIKRPANQCFADRAVRFWFILIKRYGRYGVIRMTFNMHEHKKKILSWSHGRAPVFRTRCRRGKVGPCASSGLFHPPLKKKLTSQYSKRYYLPPPPLWGKNAMRVAFLKNLKNCRGRLVTVFFITDKTQRQMSRDQKLW